MGFQGTRVGEDQWQLYPDHLKSCLLESSEWEEALTLTQRLPWLQAGAARAGGLRRLKIREGWWWCRSKQKSMASPQAVHTSQVLLLATSHLSVEQPDPCHPPQPHSQVTSPTSPSPRTLAQALVFTVLGSNHCFSPFILGLPCLCT